MEEEFISFETAKLAKEKKFNIPTKFYFYPSAYDEFTVLNDEMKIDSNGHPSDSYITVSTQSLLQKWIREKQEIDVLVDKWDKDYIYKIKKEDEQIPENTSTSFKSISSGKKPFFQTYEEALEQGLKEGLKLI